MREEAFSVDGGLEQDALRLSADAYFAAKAAYITTAAVAKQREDIYEMLSKQEGFDINSAKTQEMIDSLQGKSANAGSSSGGGIPTWHCTQCIHITQPLSAA